MYDIEPSDRPVVVHLRLDLGTAFRAAVQAMLWLFQGFILGYAVRWATSLPMPH